MSGGRGGNINIYNIIQINTPYTHSVCIIMVSVCILVVSVYIHSPFAQEKSRTVKQI